MLSEIDIPKNSKFAYLVFHFDLRFMDSNRETSKNQYLDSIICSGLEEEIHIGLESRDLVLVLALILKSSVILGKDSISVPQSFHL